MLYAVWTKILMALINTLTLISYTISHSLNATHLKAPDSDLLLITEPASLTRCSPHFFVCLLITKYKVNEYKKTRMLGVFKVSPLLSTVRRMVCCDWLSGCIA